MSTVVIRDQIEEVSFGFYTDSDVRSRSVVEVDSSVTFDALGNALPRGLYDPRMGLASSGGPGADSSCFTCGNPYLYCPGHCGHIELCVPVYHILTFPKLLQLLKTKCLFCHGLRVAKHMVSKRTD
jgi:DNA-directed RNA polymerase I subunit RPA1